MISYHEVTTNLLGPELPSPRMRSPFNAQGMPSSICFALICLGIGKMKHISPALARINFGILKYQVRCKEIIYVIIISWQMYLSNCLWWSLTEKL